jgi:type II secretory pathway pseudopilin PulG
MVEREGGFTLLGLLVVVVIINIGLGVAVTSWMIIDQRAKEAELIWRGQQYIRALQCHRDQTGGYPEELDELLESDCIRALYPDPMSRGGEWRLLRENDLQPAPGGEAARGAAALDAIDLELRGPEAFFGGGQAPPGVGPAGGAQQGPDSLRNDSLRQAFERFSALGRALDERTGGGSRIIGVASTSTQSSLRTYQDELTYDAWWFLAQ